jgi:hypothetical protein
LIEKAAHREGIDNLGLLVGKATSIADLGTFGRIICQSLTVYDAFNTVKNMINANNSGEIFWIKEQEKTAYFCQRYLHNQEVNCHYAAQFASRLMIELVSIALGKLWQPPTIYLQGERGCDLKDESLSRTKILAGMGFTAIVFDIDDEQPELVDIVFEDGLEIFRIPKIALEVTEYESIEEDEIV